MNKIYAIIGPHAAGKTAIISKLKAQGIPFIVSHTTRTPRPDEKDGREYYFVTKEEFFKLDLVEKVTYQGEYYGIAKNELLTKMQSSKINTVMVEQSGYKQLKKLLGDRLESIYIMVDYVTMVERMLNNKETSEQIKKQLEYTETNGELENWKITNYVVKNINNINTTINQILAIMGLLARK